jgi:hypothetical protein
MEKYRVAVSQAQSTRTWRGHLPAGEAVRRVGTGELGANRPATGCSEGETVSLLREPDAGKPPVRFDEREVETGQGMASEAPAHERAGNR